MANKNTTSTGSTSAIAAEGSSDSTHKLTKLEAKMLRLRVNGAGETDVAIELGLSSHTVAILTQNLFRKLGCRDAFSAVAKAIRLGLIE